MQTLRYLPDVVTLTLDVEKCIGCDTCVDVCPHQVFAVEDKKARIADRDACMECGACAQNCPVQAVYVRPGVGCAAGIILGAISGTEATCGCSTEASEMRASLEGRVTAAGCSTSAISEAEPACGCSPAASETPATLEEPAEVGGYAAGGSETP